MRSVRDVVRAYVDVVDLNSAWRLVRSRWPLRLGPFGMAVGETIVPVIEIRVRFVMMIY